MVIKTDKRYSTPELVGVTLNMGAMEYKYLVEFLQSVADGVRFDAIIDAQKLLAALGESI